MAACPSSRAVIQEMMSLPAASMTDAFVIDVRVRAARDRRAQTTVLRRGRRRDVDPYLLVVAAMRDQHRYLQIGRTRRVVVDDAPQGGRLQGIGREDRGRLDSVPAFHGRVDTTHSSRARWQRTPPESVPTPTSPPSRQRRCRWHRQTMGGVAVDRRQCVSKRRLLCSRWFRDHVDEVTSLSFFP